MKYQEVVKVVNEVIGQYVTRLTVRQIYYRIVSPPYQLFANTIPNFKGFDKILTRARENRDVDWTRIEDRHRRTSGGESDTFEGPEQYVDWIFGMLSDRYYKKVYWEKQPKYVEVWVEKDALAPLFEDACNPYRVVILPSKGYSSYTKIMEAIQRFPNGKEIIILHFADHDPSGVNMTDDLVNRFRRYGADVEVKRIALSIAQVKQWELAPNPTKKADKRTAGYLVKYGDACWELDAVPPDELHKLVRDAVAVEVDKRAWDRITREIEDGRSKISKALKKSKRSLDRIEKNVKKRLKD